LSHIKKRKKERNFLDLVLFALTGKVLLQSGGNEWRTDLS